MSSHRLPPRYLDFLCANNLMHGRKSLRVTDEIPLSDVSKDQDKEICPKLSLSVPQKEEKASENLQDQVKTTTEEERKDVADVSVEELDSQVTDESVKILEEEENMGLISSKKYEDVVPATQDQEEYEMVIEEDPEATKQRLIIEGSSRTSKDLDPETKKALFDLYGGTTPAKSPENATETQEKGVSENGAVKTSEKFDVSTSSRKTRIFEELKDTISDEPVQKRRKSGRTPKKTLNTLPLPDLPEDHSNILQEFGLKGYNKCNDEKLGNMKISGRDFNSLRGCQFLNDTVIDKYLELICQRSIEQPEYRKTAAVSCFFPICLDRGNMKSCLAFFPKNTFEYELLLIPTNEDSHWYLFVVDFVNLTLFCYDSLDITISRKSKRKKILDALKVLAENEKKEVNWNEWSEFPTEEQTGPSQVNGYDCGVYVLQYADRISRNVGTLMCDTQMPYYRRRMIYELLKGELLPPSPY